MLDKWLMFYKLKLAPLIDKEKRGRIDIELRLRDLNKFILDRKVSKFDRRTLSVISPIPSGDSDSMSKTLTGTSLRAAIETISKAH